MNRFKDSADAQNHIDQIKSLLADPKLFEWVKSTDRHFLTDANTNLKAAIQAVADLQATLDSAD